MTDWAGVSSPVSVLADHTGLAASAIRLLLGFSGLGISFVWALFSVGKTFRTVHSLSALSTSRVWSIVISTDSSIATVTSCTGISDETSSAIVRLCAGDTLGFLGVHVFSVRAVKLSGVTTSTL